MIDSTVLLIAGGVMLGLGGGLSIILAIANKTLHVHEDPRIDTVEDMLPGANCGACGLPGCRAMAEKIVKGEISPSKCPVNAEEELHAIAGFLGIEAGAQAKRVARLACAGGTNVAYTRAFYDGITTCRGAVLVAGGGKGCAWGCLGYGDCGTVCPFDAITISELGLPVVDEDKCTGCGNCVDACPRSLFSIHPMNHRLWVACKNMAAGAAAKKQCAVACIGCSLCAKDAAPEVVTINNKLACVNYEKNEEASTDAIQRCPTGAIVWLDDEKGVIKGAKAKPVEQTTPLPVG